MKGTALVLGEVITLIVRHQVYDRPLGQGCRLIEDQPPVLDTSSERAHTATLRVSQAAGKRMVAPDSSTC